MRPGSRLNGMLRMSPPIDLADVTICAADSAFVELTARALRLSMEQARFGDAILFSDAPVPGPYRSIEIQPLNSIGAYSRFVLQRLPDFIKTPFALVVQWDGYVVNPAAWANAFRKYDYIGAAWHGKLEPGTRRVGNGGFSLRSRKLLAATKKLPPVAGYNEDALICHAFGDQLEREAGIRFAPVKIADRFSYESHVPDGRPFGFHGFRNLWRHSSDEELATGLEQLNLQRMDPTRALKFIHACWANGHSASARSLYRHFRPRHSSFAIESELRKLVGRDNAAAELRALEQLVAE